MPSCAPAWLTRGAPARPCPCLPAADILLYDLTDLHTRALGPEFGSAYPQLAAHHAKLAAVPGLKAYLGSSRQFDKVGGQLPPLPSADMVHAWGSPAARDGARWGVLCNLPLRVQLAHRRGPTSLPLSQKPPSPLPCLQVNNNGLG